ncbi:MAG: ATP-dependent DNA helicase RecG [Candidatus Marinimicrobia bacterium]|nr:ATP-dependent DNA helicase RecG [Candidatus Neomarinimicrobiota bacterium]
MPVTSVSKPSIKPDTPVTYVKGVGPKRAEALAEIGIRTFTDLIYYFPRRYLDRSTITKISRLKVGEQATIVGEVTTQRLVRTARRSFYEIFIKDDSGLMSCIWFNGVKYIQNVFKAGDLVAMHSRVEFFNGPRFVHPDYDRLETAEWDSTLHTARIIPLYPTTAELKKVALDSRGFRRLLRPIVDKFEWAFDEILPFQTISRLKLLSINEGFRQIHFPETLEILEKSQVRFKFEELFYLELMLGVKKAGIKASRKTFQYPNAGSLIKQVYEKIPFALTIAQKRVVHEIWDDMKSSEVMNRLLQGDVGSGKTIVALLCASIAIGNGFQVAFMAPTEILAEQHYRNLKVFADLVGIEISVLIGGQKKTERDEILQSIQSGKAQLVVGTHALIQEGVEFKNLSLVIIDEQHRFGVLQRGTLIGKGLNPDVLVMTATPIPRTLSMTLYGDMDVSILDEMPSQKGKIVTKLVNEDRIAEAYNLIREQVKKRFQAYIVYPLIEESEKIDLKAATQGFEYLQRSVFSEFKLALLHGGMSPAEKDDIMRQFIAGTVNILVSTTVIEVGMDNPKATVMLIENAERFGLTQIHQLRGRIGRGKTDGICILVERKRTEISQRRLQTILSTTDGFEISEEDLKLRGPGEFYGARQHGFLKMKIADLITDKELLKVARSEAFDLLKSDPHLRKQENIRVRNHLLTNYSEYMDFVNIL